MKRLREGGGWVTALLLAGLCACTPRLTVERQALLGSFSGTTADGEAVVVTFAEEEAAFRGAGTIDGEPIVVAGAVGWRGSGSLVRSDGTAELVELTLSADGERVVVEPLGREAFTLERGGAAPPAGASGPFAGSYRAVRDRAPLAEVTLVQRGELLAGFGIVTSDPVGVSGRVTGASTARGVVTFSDGTQVRFEAELAADGESLVVRGFGEPMTLGRRGPS